MSRKYQGIDHAKPSSGEGLPISVELRASGAGNAAMLAVGVAVTGLGVATYFQPAIFSSALSASPYRLIIPAALGLFGLRFVLSGLRSLGANGQVRIEPDKVIFQRRSLFGKERWEEPLSAFRGVRWSQQHRIGKTREVTDRTPSRTVQWIELAHGDEARSVPLFSGEVDNVALRREWERLAGATGLPAIDSREVDDVSRDAKDIDRSLMDRIKSSDTDTEIGEATPPRLTLLRGDGSEDQVTSITLPAKLSDFQWRALQALFALVLVIGVLTFSFGIIVCAGAFLALFEFFRRQSAETPRTLTVSQGELTYVDPSSSRQSFTLPLSEIQSIDVIRARIGKMEGRESTVKAVSQVASRRVLSIGSDRGEYRIGSLSDDEFTWLRQFLFAQLKARRE